MSDTNLPKGASNVVWSTEDQIKYEEWRRKHLGLSSTALDPYNDDELKSKECHHEYKEYNSGWKAYHYCIKCNIVKND